MQLKLSLAIGCHTCREYREHRYHQHRLTLPYLTLEYQIHSQGAWFMHGMSHLSQCQFLGICGLFLGILGRAVCKVGKLHVDIRARTGKHAWTSKTRVENEQGNVSLVVLVD